MWYAILVVVELATGTVTPVTADKVFEAEEDCYEFIMKIEPEVDSHRENYALGQTCVYVFGGREL